jgi:hypothetical protein
MQLDDKFKTYLYSDKKKSGNIEMQSETPSSPRDFENVLQKFRLDL